MPVSLNSQPTNLAPPALIESAPSMTWIVGPDQQIPSFNHDWLAFTGHTPKQQPGNGWLAAVHPADVDHCLETYRHAFTTQREFAQEYRLRRHDGVYCWVLERASPQFDGDGTFLGFAGNLSDITERRQLEARLQQSEARFQAAQELSLDSFVLLESVRNAAGAIVDFTFTYLNPSAARILGRPATVLVGQRLLTHYPSVYSQSDLFARWVQVVETGVPHDIETWYDAEGIQGWFRNMAVKLADGLAITFHEISERKWLEEALLAGEEAATQQLAELQAIYATALVGLAVLDRLLRYVRINQHLAAINGRPAAAHIGRTVYEMIPERAPEVAIALQQVLQHGEPMVEREIHSSAPSPAGWVRSFLQSCYPLRNRQGQVVALNVVVQEITERKRHEAALQRLVACTLTSGTDFFQGLTCALSEALGVRYAFVGELLPDEPAYTRTIALWADGKLADNVAYELAGSPCAEVMKQQPCCYPRNVQGLFPTDLMLGEMGVESYLGAPLRAADGATLGLLVVMHDRPFEQPQQALALVQIFAGHAAAELERMRNEQALRLSEERYRQAEAALRQANERLEQRVAERTGELERSNRDLDQFAYAASHDLKAPLHAIRYLAGCLEEEVGTQLPPASQQHLQLLQGRAQRLETLLTDLLAYARAGRQPHASEVVDTGALVDNIVELLVPPPGFTISHTHLPTLRTLRVPLETVLRNLINNAIKHHHRSDGRVQVAVEEEGDFLRFSVQDDGPGIPTQHRARIFDLFQTLQPRDKVEGSGMGLALVKKLVERYGGVIQVESAEGQGATFHFTWPRTPPLPLRPAA